MKQHRHTWVTFLASGIAAGAVCLCLSACGAPKDPKAEETASGAESAAAEVPHGDFTGKRVSISMPATPARWTKEGELLKQLLESEGCQVNLVYAAETPAQGESEQGIAQSTQQALDTAGLIAGGCDVLILGSNEDGTLPGVLSAAKEQGIPVVAYDRLIMDTDALSYYVSYDSYKEGQMQGSYVASALNLSIEDNSKEHHVEFVAGNPGDYRSAYLFNGAYDTLKPYLDAGVLSIPSGQATFFQVATVDGTAENAKARLEGILQENYGNNTSLDAVLSSTDEVAAGAAEAASSRMQGKHPVILTGLGSGELGLANVADGKQAMTLYEDREKEVTVTAALACALLTGDAADANLILDSGWEFSCIYDTASYDNGEGIVPAYLLEPSVITAANVSTITPETT